MGKHKTTKEWKYWFNKYESDTLVWSEYYKTISFTRNHKDRFKRVRSAFFKKYNLYKKQGDIIITSMTGKKASGRPKKQKCQTLKNEKERNLKKLQEDITK